MKVVAGIVLYNPNLDRLLQNISAIANQVDKIILYDNNSTKINFDQSILNNFNNVELILGEKNIGISGALNFIAKKSLKQYQWMLTLDQDSICPSNLISEYEKYINDTTLGMLTIRAEDYRRGIPKESKIKIEYVKRTITSGSLVNLKVLSVLGFFDEYMFIDYVDYEYCQRLLSNNYKILKLNYLILNQEFGMSIPSQTIRRIGKIIHCKNKYFYEPHYITGYSKERIFYSLRNAVYVAKKYKELSILHESLVILFWLLERILIEPNRLTLLYYGLKGYFIGLLKPVKNKQ